MEKGFAGGQAPANRDYIILKLTGSLIYSPKKIKIETNEDIKSKQSESLCTSRVVYVPVKNIFLLNKVDSL